MRLLYRFRIDPLTESDVVPANEANSTLRIWLEPEGVAILLQKLESSYRPGRVMKLDIRGAHTSPAEEVAFLSHRGQQVTPS